MDSTLVLHKDLVKANQNLKLASSKRILPHTLSLCYIQGWLKFRMSDSCTKTDFQLFCLSFVLL